MPKGFDTVNDCASLAQAIAQNNYDFVCRYYGSNTNKCLTQAELAALSGAGIKIVTVWEDLPTADSYFTHQRGVDEGTSAYHDAVLVGQPANSAIYFAVDYDASATAVAGPISDYFHGIADGFAAMGRGNPPQYSVGVYGSGSVCKAIIEAGLATYSWLAGARDWSGSASYNTWNICQTSSGSMFGIGVDLDNAIDSFGGF